MTGTGWAQMPFPTLLHEIHPTLIPQGEKPLLSFALNWDEIIPWDQYH